MIKSIIDWFKIEPYISPERPTLTCDDVVMDERMLSELSPAELIWLKNNMSVASSMFPTVMSEYQVRLVDGPRKVKA